MRPALHVQAKAAGASLASVGGELRQASLTVMPNMPEARPLQQEQGNEICIIVYNDVNQNSVQDEGEVLIGGLDVNLTVDDIIIQSFLTSSQDYQCFTGLPIGKYRVIIPETSRHQLTTRNDLSPEFEDTGNRVHADFGGFLVDPFSEDALLPTYGFSDDEFTLDHNTRLLLAIFGMTLAMLLMISFGAIILGLMRRR